MLLLLVALSYDITTITIDSCTSTWCCFKSHNERLETENGNVGMEKITNSDINMYGNVKNDDKEEFNSQFAGKG